MLKSPKIINSPSADLLLVPTQVVFLNTEGDFVPEQGHLCADVGGPDALQDQAAVHLRRRDRLRTAARADPPGVGVGGGGKPSVERILTFR